MDQYFTRIQYRILKFRSMYGVNSSVRGNLCFTPNFDFSQTEYSNFNVITYICGNALVFKNPSTHVDRVETLGSADILGITHLNYFPEEKFLCVAFRGKRSPFINFYDISSRPLRKRIQLNVPDNLPIDEYICFDKGLDGETFIALGGAPEYYLVVWTFDGIKSKLFGHIKTTSKDGDPVTQCSISPCGKFVCVSGNGVFKILELDHKRRSMEVVKDRLRENFRKENVLCHRWLTPKEGSTTKGGTKVIAINDLGNIFLCENHTLVTKLQFSPDDQLNLNSVIEVGEKGFVCGGEKGIIHMYTLSNDADVLFKRTKVMKLDADDLESSIVDMAYDPESSLLCCMTETGGLYSIKLSGEKKAGGNDKEDESEKSSDENEESSESEIPDDVHDEEEDGVTDFVTDFECLMNFHSGPVLDVDTCIQKPFVVTAGADRTVRILDYRTSRVTTKRFKQELFSVAIHPTGFYLLIGFSDYLKFFKLLGSNLQEHCSFPVRNCSSVRFSRGGHLFAAVYGTVINVYSTYHQQQLHTLRGHNGRIRSFCWKDSDTRIASVDINGTMIDFGVSTEKKIDENAAGKTSFSSVTSQGGVVYAAGSDGNIHVFHNQVPLEKCTTGVFSPTALAASEDLGQLFVGLEDGCVCIYDTTQDELDDYDDRFYVHSSSVLSLRLSHDSKMLFSVATDGSLCQFEVKGRQTNTVQIKAGTLQFSREILISKIDLEEMNNNINHLKAKYRELKADNDYERKKKEMEYTNKIKDQKNKFQFELKERDEQIGQLEGQLQSQNRQFVQDLKEVEGQYKRNVEDLDKGLQQQITNTLNQLKEMTLSKEREVSDLKTKYVGQRKREHGKLVKMESEFEEEKRKKKEAKRKLNDQMQREKAIHDETMKQTVEDHETLTTRITDSYEQSLREQREQNLKLSGENTIKENNEKEHEKLIKSLQNTAEELQLSLKKQELLLKKKASETKAVMAENTERENTIVEKEKKIFELKKQNQELEKHKFVLDHKINTLTELIKPTKDHIQSMRKLMKKKGVKLERCKEDNVKLVSEKKMLEERVKKQKKTVSKLRLKIRKHVVSKTRLKSDVHDLTQYIQDPKVVKKKFRVFFKKWSAQVNLFKLNSNGPETLYDKDVKEETERQQKYLEMTIDSLRKKLAKTVSIARKESMRIMQENVMLINEINVLRNEAKLQKSQLRENEERNAIMGGNEGGRYEEEDRLIEEERKKKAQQIQRQIELNKIEIENLRARIKELELEKRARSRPTSKGQLPPLRK